MTVLVAGAGPTGLALACALRLHGVEVRVLDRATGPAETSRANFLHARGSEVLARLGALGELPRESIPAMRITTYAGARPIMRIRFGDPGLRTAAPPMVVSQARVEGALRARLAELGVEPEWGTEVTGAEQDGDGVRVRLGDGGHLTTSWLVGCDGSGSAVRRLAGIGFPGAKLSERFLLADLDIDWDLDRDGTSGWVHPDGLFAAMPMPGGSWRLFSYDPDGGTERPEPTEIVDRLRQHLARRTGRTATFGHCTWASVFSVHRRLADTYRRGRIFLAGDAAHVHAPFGGQGMPTGMGDAENLAWKLAMVIDGQAAPELLDTYEAERRPLAENVLRGTALATRVNIADSAAGRFLRDKVLIKLGGLPWVQRKATYTASQLWVSYRKGPLGGRRPLGDRIADLDCVREDASRTTLHAELGGTWALLLPASGGGRVVEEAREGLGKRVVVLRRTDEGQAPALVRPDGHLAWRGETGLGDWLAGALGRAG
ncbi:FAD-dependent monooxygenase [Amycolatopsis lurida]